uniref:CRAL-TRIO domain-containing protein n=1 Tax=Kalanchoe fedtschenkoi TaxID=63787 RepID=A0A7N0TML0_KALFE
MDPKDGAHNGNVDELLDSDEVEKSKVGIMRARVEREDPSAKDVDNLMLRRFLRARELDIDKASNMFLKYLNWRRTFVPNGFISESEITKNIEHNKLFMQGRDKLGRPIVFVYAARHLPTTVEEVKRYVVYTLDKIISRMPSGQEKYITLTDVEGWGYANTDIRGALAALSILQDCYPERLGKMFIINAPYIFMAMWKVIYPFIDSKTKKKIVFVEKKKQLSTLLEEIDESQLPEIFGGKLKLVPIQEA